MPNGQPLPFLCPRYTGASGTPSCQFQYDHAMYLSQHNATLPLMLGRDATSYEARHTLPTVVGRARGDVITAHAVGDWRTPPGAGGAPSFAGCMPFRYNGLRSETSAEVKGEVLAAMRFAYKAAVRDHAPPTRYWDYLPKNLAVWATCRAKDGETDAEEEMQLDVAGSDASEVDESLLDSAQILKPTCRRTAHGISRREPPKMPDSEPPAQYWWAAARRGGVASRHFARSWSLLSPEVAARASLFAVPTRHKMIAVCTKQFMNCVNGVQDPAILQLPPCPRCLSTGLPQPAAVRPVDDVAVP